MKIYNTLTRKKEKFIPLEEMKVKMYTCGPTVYHYIHIGNARMSVFFDVVRRYFLYKGYEVDFVQNITDVDDRIITSSRELGISESELSEEYLQKYNEDLASLNVIPPSAQPKVTDHIPEIITFIENLMKKGFAYELNGDVYFRVKHFRDYGKLTNQSLSTLRHTERDVVIIDKKENPFDFALWKSQKYKEIAWKSPWGLGRPGWHIECSAMSMKYLGETFDIHGGGMDLCFPHHENEIAQSEALSGQPFAHTWMHNNYVTVDGQKMSKSLGNFTTVRDALERYSGEAIRMFFLSNNYRNLVDYSETALVQAETNVETLKNFVLNLGHYRDQKEEHLSVFTASDVRKECESRMDDDFDTSGVLSVLFDFVREINKKMNDNDLSKKEAASVYDDFIEMTGMLGFDFSSKNALLDEEIEELIEKRNLARKNKDFVLSDSIRDELKSRGIVLEDTIHGTRWKRT